MLFNFAEHEEVFMWLLENSDRNIYFSLLPSKYMEEQGKKIIPIISNIQKKFHGIIPQLPRNVVSSLSFMQPLSSFTRIRIYFIITKKGITLYILDSVSILKSTDEYLIVLI